MTKLTISVPEDSSPVNEKEAEKASVKDDEDEDEDEDDEDLPWLDVESKLYVQARLFAEASLKFFNESDEGNKYELVEPGPHRGAGISGGPILHLNFKGKARDCPGAEVETFFAQIRMHPGQVVDCCVSLGPSRKLPHWSKADLRGCKYCKCLVQHPSERCNKLITGVDREEGAWLYGDMHDSEDSADYYDYTDDSDCEESESSIQ